MKTLCWFDVYFIRFKIQINWVISSKIFCLLRKSKLYSFYDIWIQLLFFFLLFMSAFFLADSLNSSRHNFSSKYFCSFELSCGCFVLSNAMWVVLGARSCHWVVFEKSAVLQLNELFWAKPSLKIRTASAIFWIYLSIFKNYGLNYFFFRNKTFLFFKIENWNFQNLFEIEFREIATHSDNC